MPILKVLFFGFAFLVSLATQATVLSLDSEFAKGATSATIGVDHTAEKISDRSIQFLGIGVFIGGDSVKTENSSTQETTTTKTQNGGAWVRISLGDYLRLTASGSATRTPETNYKESGGQVKLDGKVNSEWSLGVLGGGSNIEQKYSFKILNRTIEREITLEKEYSGIYLSFNQENNFNIQIGTTIYKYSKAKSELQTAFQNQFLNNYVTDLVSSISGLPEVTVYADLSYIYSDDIELSAYLQNSKLIVDDSNTQRAEILLTKYFESFSASLGAGQSRSKDGNSGSILLGYGYDF